MFDKFKAWLDQPFSSSMSALDWALFVLFLIVVAFLWTRVLSVIIEDA